MRMHGTISETLLFCSYIEPTVQCCCSAQYRGEHHAIHPGRCVRFIQFVNLVFQMKPDPNDPLGDITDETFCPACLTTYSIEMNGQFCTCKGECVIITLPGVEVTKSMHAGKQWWYWPYHYWLAEHNKDFASLLR